MTAEKESKKNLNNDELYRNSSQYRFWSYTSKELLQKREEVNAKSTNKMKEIWNSSEAYKDLNLESLDANEENQLVLFYARRAETFTDYFKLPSQVKATAISYLRKFYLVNTVAEYHPKSILYTCVFLAAKTENCFIKIETFAEAIEKATPQEILDLEFLVLQSLNFTLLVHHPFRPLYGFFLDMQTVFQNDNRELGALYDSSRKKLDSSLYSDACFLYTPPQIALAALLEVNEAKTMEYLNNKYNGKEQLLNALLGILQDCRKVINNSPDPSQEEVKIIDRKLRYAVHPEKKLQQQLKKRRLQMDQSSNNANADTTADNSPGHKKPRLDS